MWCIHCHLWGAHLPNQAANFTSTSANAASGISSKTCLGSTSWPSWFVSRSVYYSEFHSATWNGVIWSNFCVVVHFDITLNDMILEYVWIILITSDFILYHPTMYLKSRSGRKLVPRCRWLPKGTKTWRIPARCAARTCGWKLTWNSLMKSPWLFFYHVFLKFLWQGFNIRRTHNLGRHAHSEAWTEIAHHVEIPKNTVAKSVLDESSSTG